MKRHWRHAVCSLAATAGLLAPPGLPAQPAGPAAAAQGGQPAQFGPMRVRLPPGWARLGGAPGTDVSYALDGLAAPHQAFVSFSSGPDGGAAQAVAHQVLWQHMVAQLGTARPGRTGQAGRFTWSDAQVHNTHNQRMEWHRLYGTKQGDVHVAVSVAATSEAAYTHAVAAAEAVLAAADFGPAARAPAAPAAVARPALPVGQDDVPIMEAHVHVEMRAISATSSVLTDHILFFGNGVALRTGVIHGARECYALHDVRNPSRLSSNHGHWREDRGTVHVQWQEGSPWVLKREAGRLSLNGRQLLALRPIEGVRLEGAYIYRPVGDPPSRLDFEPGGRFTATHLRESMTCAAQARPGALAGSGTYAVRKWTLILQFDNGATTLLPMHVEPDQDLQRVSRFWLKGLDFEKVR